MPKDLDERQIRFLALYTDPRSKTFSNAKQSAIEAGYSKEYAENITHLMPEWLSENIGDMSRLSKALDALDEALEIDVFDEEGKINTSVFKTKVDVGKFVAERLGKDKYSKKTQTDITSDGEKIKQVTVIKSDGSENKSNTQTNGGVGSV